MAFVAKSILVAMTSFRVHNETVSHTESHYYRLDSTHFKSPSYEKSALVVSYPSKFNVLPKALSTRQDTMLKLGHRRRSVDRKFS